MDKSEFLTHTSLESKRKLVMLKENDLIVIPEDCIIEFKGVQPPIGIFDSPEHTTFNTYIIKHL